MKWRGATMTMLNVSLSDEAKKFLEKQASKHGLSTSGEFVERLVSQAMAREEQERLEEQLLDGMNSGSGIEADDAYWQRKQAELIGRANQARGDRA
jgi:antitoxin ParD1/3/4